MILCDNSILHLGKPLFLSKLFSDVHFYCRPIQYLGQGGFCRERTVSDNITMTVDHVYWRQL